MPTPLLLGGQEFIYFNENPFKNNYKKKLNTTKISDKDAINKRTITGASNESIYKIIIQYLFYTIILLIWLDMFWRYSDTDELEFVDRRISHSSWS